MKKILVCGAGGFIGHHLVKALKSKGNYVIAADLKFPEFESTYADEFFVVDLRNSSDCAKVIDNNVEEIYQLAADMGGAGYISTGDNDADILHNSCLINLNVLNCSVKKNVKKIFYTSTACVYPEYNQLDPNNPNCSEDSVYPAQPDSEYGWEKLFSERLYLSYSRNYGLQVRIARLHNIFGPYGTFRGGKEKAPAALCRKIAESKNNTIDVWGDGNQTRSFLYIDECITGILKIMESDYQQPLNLGSDRLISINDFVRMISIIADKDIKINYIPGPVGVAGRNSHNDNIQKILQWKPKNNLEYGIEQTYKWIAKFYE